MTCSTFVARSSFLDARDAAWIPSPTVSLSGGWDDRVTVLSAVIRSLILKAPRGQRREGSGIWTGRVLIQRRVLKWWREIFARETPSRTCVSTASPGITMVGEPQARCVKHTLFLN